ncbi:MAG: succinate dehydrogenase, cytochrome b556 subunit [Methylotenera sp.]|nr:succinate dehydrogenase, cytochrome b556 subunit [Methylotenera sp.]MDP1754888.1 succinate dehydrogenase, cytochrome b556 subunit [Methylotenera sp.]MDP1960007.1 succinate dehydrogenase, cytochrome b556 subunit [Methylotenera sp.]MDP3207303.1 succinate dehydrogenase, cytochrome b556 subunit [Methylotenera sp.]MDP3303477.1 succinate dehydrogenase, cytochrome b556 subunit [Methylotenera sp.]
MQALQSRKRPKNLNLFTIRLPVNAIISIMHRMSGMLLFLTLPAVVWALSQSVQSEASYIALVDMLQHWLVKLFLIAFSCTFFHHFYAGLRHLGMDVHWMTSLQKARLSSRLVLYLDVLSVMAFAFVIW